MSPLDAMPLNPCVPPTIAPGLLRPESSRDGLIHTACSPDLGPTGRGASINSGWGGVVAAR